MSDYLDRLVTRSFGLSPGVGPRLPSLFEPPRAADGFQIEPPRAAADIQIEPPPGVELSHTPPLIEEADAAAPTQAARPRAREAAPRGMDEGVIQPAQRRGRTAAPHLAPSPSDEDATQETERTASAHPPQARREEAQAPETIISPPTHAPRVAAEISGNYIDRLLTPPPAAVDEAGRTAESFAPHELGPPLPARTLSAAQTEAPAASDEARSGQLSEVEQQVEGLRRQIEVLQSRRAPAEQRNETRAAVRETFVERGAQAPASTPTPALLDPRTAQRAHTEAPKSVVIPKSVVVQPHVARYEGPRAAVSAQSAARAPEPTINVTIGRIEVRAAMQSESQSQPERRSHAPQAMNLQEYLRRRAGGHS